MRRRHVRCPSCGWDGSRDGMNGSSFIFLEEVTNEREVFGINEKGALEVSARDHIGVEDPGQNERLCCGNCLTEFPIPKGLEIHLVERSTASLRRSA